MNWEAIGAIGEIVGALAVVITLIFLSVQLRQNTKSTRIATRTSIAEAYSGIIGTVQSPDFADCILKGLSDFDSLTDNEQVRFISFIRRQLHIFEISFFYWHEGELDDTSWRAEQNRIIDTLSMPGVLRVYELRKPWLDERFTEYVDGLLRDGTRKAKIPYVGEI